MIRASALAERRRGRGVRTLVGAVLTGALVVSATACSGGTDGTPTPSSTPRALTPAEGKLLAEVGVRNRESGVRTIDMVIPKTGDTDRLHVVGWYDFADEIGYASVTQGDEGIGVVTGDMTWSPDSIAIVTASVSAVVDVAPAGEPATDGWAPVALDPQRSVLTAALAAVSSLGAEKAQDPSALVASDAAHLRTDTVEDESVEVFSGGTAGGSGLTSTDGTSTGSGALVYWLDAAGLALRVDVPVTGTTATVLLGTADPGTVPDLDALQKVLNSPSTD